MTHSHSELPAVTLSVRVSPEMRGELESLADATGRTKSFLAAEAIAAYLEINAWQINATKKALKKAKSKDAKFIRHDKVKEWLLSWGTKTERKRPK